MDEGLDDLFGEGPTLQLPEPLPRGLPQRIDEQSLSGCCQKLAWSNLGCIAYISYNGCNVGLRHLQCDSYDGQWKLSKEYLVDDVPNLHNQQQIVHVSWDPTGLELAVVDIFGKISVYSVMLAINRLAVLRKCLSDPEDNLGALVGLMWLPTDRQTFFYKPMQKSVESWNFNCLRPRLLGPRSPQQKPTLVAITRGGTIKVLFPGPDGKFQEFKNDVENLASVSEILTHASMCVEKIMDQKSSEKGRVEQKIPEKDSHLLLATYSVNSELRVYKASLDFERQSIGLKHIRVASHCAPLDEHSDLNLTSYGLLPSNAQLSLLDFISPGPKIGAKDSTQPFILACFSQASEGDQNQSTQPSQSTWLCRWELQIETPKLHECFDSLSSKKTSATSTSSLPPEYILKRAKDLFVSRTILSVHQVNMSTTLVIVYCDGLIEYRDRTTLDVLPRYERERITSLGQIGFDFGTRRSCLSAVMSPNICAVASLDDQHVPFLSFMQFESANAGFPIDQPTLEVVNEAFAMQAIQATMNAIPENHSDDILATMQLFVGQHLANSGQPEGYPILGGSDTFKWRFLSEAYRILTVQTDYSIDIPPQQILQNKPIQRWLSIQATLGYAGDEIGYSLPGIVAWVMLNLRYITMALSQAVIRKQGAESDLKNPEMVRFLIPLVSWIMALVAFIVDEIFTLGDHFEDQNLDADSITHELLNQLITESRSPALPLLLISSSRAFLKVASITMKNLEKACATTQQGPMPLLAAYLELGALFQKSPIRLHQFERLLASVDNSIKTTYQTSTPTTSDTDRITLERDMLIKAEIPPMLLPPAIDLLTKTTASLKEEVNVAELYFTDISWLGLTHDGKTRRWRKAHPLDEMRKVELKRDVRTRRCTRCGIVTEDVLPYRGMNVILMTLQRACLCGSWWMVGSGEGDGSRGEF